MTHLVLIRGLPGSGKSTLAKAFIGYKHVEADQFFTVNGEYNFDRSRINEAHQWCQDTTEAYLKQYHSVVVSNTFTQRWEMQPYKDMAFRLHATLPLWRRVGTSPTSTMCLKIQSNACAEGGKGYEQTQPRSLPLRCSRACVRHAANTA